MADTVTNDVLFNSSRYVSIHLTNLSDSTGESAVNKLDVSTLQGAPEKVTLEEISWSVTGFAAVVLLWDKTGTDEPIVVCNGDGRRCFDKNGGNKAPSAAAGTNDVLLTTVGAAANAAYDILLKFRIGK